MKRIIQFFIMSHAPILLLACCGVILMASLFLSSSTNPQQDQSVVGGMSGNMIPRWICPSATPLPTRIKVGNDDPLSTPETTPTSLYYEPWEQEYGLPLQTPTPYVKQGSSFFFQQYVELRPNVFVYVTYQTRPTTIRAVSYQLVLVSLRWNNKSGVDVPLRPLRQIVVTAVQLADGRKQQGEWYWSADAATAAGLTQGQSLESWLIPRGESSLQIPILAPGANVTQIDVRIDPPNAVDTVSDGTLRVQFTQGQVRDCIQPEGVMTGLPYDPANPAQGMPIPPGADAMLASALKQVGRQYCWGGKGFTPCSGCAGGQCVTPACASYPCFDCSGLTWWVYHENGITIGHGTSNQQNYPQVPFDQQAPGDLALFTTINSHSRSGITHVGILFDINGDGTMDMVHSANYPDGVIVEMNVWSKRYYRNNLILITRPPRGSGQ